MIAAITGASGYVGVNLARVLLEAGYQVRAIDRVPSAALGSRVEWVEGDVLDPASMRRALAGADLVFHLVAKITLAQEDPVAWKINTEGVRVVAEAALACGVKRMVHTSSIATFDQRQWQGPLTEAAPRATDASLPVYNRSKYAGEQEFLKVVAQGLDGVICYPTGIYGPVDHGAVLSRINAVLLDSALGKVPALVEGGFDLVDVRDVARGLLLAAEKGRRGENYLIGGHYIEMIDAFRIAANLVGRKGPRFAIPMSLLKAMAPSITWLAQRFGKDAESLSKAALEAIETSPRVDRSKAARDLGYEPRPLIVTIKELVAFLVEHEYLRLSKAA